MSAFTEENDIELYAEEEAPVLPVPTEGGEDWEGAGAMKVMKEEVGSALL